VDKSSNPRPQGQGVTIWLGERTRVRFRFPPPYTRARIVSGPFFLPEIPAWRGVPATCAAGGYLPKRPKSATFSARAVSILRLGCGYAQMVV